MNPQRTRTASFATLLLLLLDGALAQSKVTVYGVVDAAAVSTRKGGSSVSLLESGIGATSRWGLIGSEDLGGGLTAGFWLEAAFRSDTGVIGGTTAQGEASFYNRQSNVWLKSLEWGEIRLGRQNPAQVNPFFDTFAGITGFSPYASLASIGRDQGSGASIGDSRISRSISYTTPERHALGAGVLVAFRGRSEPGYKTSSAYGAEVHYARDALQLQAHYMANNTDPTTTLASFRNEWWSLGAQYKFGGTTLSYILSALVPKQAGYLNSQTHVIGLSIPNGTDMIRISPVYRKVSGRSDLNTFALGLGYDHFLSKRAVIYARGGYVANRSNAIGTLSVATQGKPGDDLPVLAAGMYFRF